ncbi:Eco57I restriction-modification methylase domain-containing protein [Actinoplanes hulinensis]|uniref:site-specific DNA-methyltransferase (adenine-specific) n=1 Tax=Actinoplanes hulinensis TaxID=1144547 RepID=A0ABS7BB11_9ACTN|nr:N-6 DNA methylase [Actinoplanes hulinensis]MBW6438256.1 Eco57I restriction-modification methylase domain-containing protein [Actinoplanes hulinensis]
MTELPSDALRSLVDTFTIGEPQYVSPRQRYLESDARSEFIDPLLRELGWDVENRAGLAPSVKDVVREQSRQSATGKPDYTLRRKGTGVLYVEAKKPSVDITADMASVFQARAYGYTAGHPIVVLTNFRDLVVYDTTVPAAETDGPTVCRLHHWRHLDFVDDWVGIRSVLSRDAVLDPTWSTRFGVAGAQRVPADEAFVDQLNRWRVALGDDIVSRRPDITVPLLNDLVQRLLNRLIFVRMCEDRGIEGAEVLRTAFSGQQTDIAQLFSRLDKRYNTGLFQPSPADRDPSLQVDSGLLRAIVENLYAPYSPFSFAVLDATFLGLVYEASLAEHLTIDRTGAPRVTLNKKLEYARREVVTTPEDVVATVVRDAVAGLPPENTEPKVLDFATGSGRFLLHAFDVLADRHARRLAEARSTKVYKTGDDEWRLHFTEKRRFLAENFYGIDVDYNAVEIARFGLLVRLLEDESSASLPSGDRILPDLTGNIVHGNTLVRELPGATEEQLAHTRPLNLGDHRLPAAFDLIVGNPPYMKTEDMRAFDRPEFEYLRLNYRLLHKQFDKYFAFVEFGLDRLRPGGCLGVVIPNKWMTLVTGEKLRERLRDDVRPVRLANFRNAQIFPGKSIYVCALVARRGHRDGFVYSEPGSLGEYAGPSPNGILVTDSLLPADPCAAWVLPADEREARVLAALRGRSRPLAELADARNGVQTSRNKVYVLDRPVVKNDLVSFIKDGRTWTVEVGITRPYLEDSRTVRSYHAVRSDARIIFPYRGLDLIPVAEMRSVYPLAWEYLSAQSESMRGRDMDERTRQQSFYAYGRKQATDYCTQSPKIIYSVNQKGDKYGLDETGVVYSSGGTAGEVALYPRDTGVSLDFLLALLDQPPVEFFLRKRGSPFRGGYFARGTDVIPDVPVPALDLTDPADRAFHDSVTAEMAHLRKLHRELAESDDRERTAIIGRIAAGKRRMDQFFLARWGLTEADVT